MKIACVIFAAVVMVPRVLFAQAPSTSSELADGTVIEGCHGESQVERVTTQDRMPEIPADKLSEAQKKATEKFREGRGTQIFGPFVPLLRSPELMLADKAMGDYLRFKSVLPPRIREFVILITARHWMQQYEWDVHCPIAIKAGLGQDIAKSVAEGRRPTVMSDDEDAAYEFCVELHRNGSVSDPTYAAALAKFGEQGVVDIVGLSGFYTLQAMILNVARTPLPKGSAPVLKPFPR
jgi:4-carboxymuconolactone decarboxylase